MTASPWIKWYTADFLNGVGAANLKADEIGVYVVILSHIADRGAPIDNDRAWIAGRSGTSTRRCNQIVERLVQLGKLEIRNDLIGNARMLREVAQRDNKSSRARDAAMARWNGGQRQPQAEVNNENVLELPATKGGFEVENKSGKNGAEPQKLAIPADADASSPRARARPRVQNSEEESQPTTPNNNCGVVAAEANGSAPLEPAPLDIRALTHRLARMGGVAMVRPAAITSNLKIVKGWIEDGVDIERTVIPAIEAQFAESKERTIGSLAYYASRVAKAHADAIAKPRRPKPMNAAERRAVTLRLIALYRRMGRAVEADEMERSLNSSSRGPKTSRHSPSRRIHGAS